MKLFTEKSLRISLVVLAIAALTVAGSQTFWLDASSHREAPMIANDPQADNTDVYAFRTDGPDHHVVIVANFIPGQLPDDGPNYYHFGENVRYEIHVKNNAATKGDDITYRFTFSQKNEDPTTFFNIRLGKENLKTTYVCEKSTDGGKTFTAIVTGGTVPPYNIGPRSINSAVGLNTTYEALVNKSMMKASSGETIFCGPRDDPFFVDLAGIMDLGNIRPDGAKDHLKCKNVHSIIMRIPIPNLQKDGLHAYNAVNVLDDRFIIGVWASASRPKIKVLEKDGKVSHQGPWVQVSRLGMPLTNEAVIPVGMKDYWNSLTPYEEGGKFDKYFTNPELALYMDDDQFGKAVPGLSKLRIQRNSLQSFDFGNTHDGLAGLLGNPATKNTALDKAKFGDYLLRKGQPRSVDLLPIFHTGVPNLRPYQLAVGKKGNPLAQGKPFINNFMPFGDMLRLNMSTPSTPRDSKDFSSLGLIKAAVLGLTDPRFNKTQAKEFIPNMDGFPNGRRLEDDVVRIELQAVSGVVLAAIGLWYDDFTVGDTNPVTPDLVNVISFTTGIEANDKPVKKEFPWVPDPVNGFELCDNSSAQSSIRSVDIPAMNEQSLNLGAPGLLMQTFPNPAINATTFKYRVTNKANVTLRIFDKDGNLVATPVSGEDKEAGTYELNYELGQLKKGTYYVTLSNEGQTVQSSKLVIDK